MSIHQLPYYSIKQSRTLHPKLNYTIENKRRTCNLSIHSIPSSTIIKLNPIVVQTKTPNTVNSKSLHTNTLTKITQFLIHTQVLLYLSVNDSKNIYS